MKKFDSTNSPLYFIPDWDDLVDPDFDFKNDVSLNKGWKNEVYAHELINPPPYDGILVSKVVEEKSKKRRLRMEKLKVHKALRVSKDFPIMGDCGAFGYANQKVPPYKTDEIVDYYSNRGFDFGVSIDHLIFSDKVEDREFRYNLTLKNSYDFINLHHKRSCKWIPVGAVQGWNPESYAEAALEMVSYGYKFLALGGLVRAKTTEIINILKEVRKVIHPETKIHLFGIAREEIFDALVKYRVFSIDSASALRRAWLGSTDNYHTANQNYCAIRVPFAGGARSPMKEFKGEQLNEAKDLEQKVLQTLRKYDREEENLPNLLDVLVSYEALYLKDPKKSRIKHYQKTLEDKPWKTCPCSICKKNGIEVAIFRGNNRNRRRGFHNTFVLYEKIKKIKIQT